MANLKIHLYTICWNEERLLPHFLKYYTGFCEKIYVYDNFSTDKSVEICNSYANVHVKQFFTANEIRDDMYLKVKNECWKQSRNEADFIIVCDVDEFIYRPDLIDFLSKAKDNGITLFQCKGYNMITEKFPETHENILEKVQYGARSENFDKVSVFNPLAIEEINFEPGAHSCLPFGKVSFSENEIILLHYKFMELNYLIERYSQMASRLSKYNKKFKFGFHYFFSARKIKNEFNIILKNRIKVIE